MLQKPPVQQAIAEGENAAAASGAYKAAIASKQASAPSTLCRLWFPLFKDRPEKRPSMIVHSSPSRSAKSANSCPPFVTFRRPCRTHNLDLPQAPSQTSSMAHTYMVFEFPNEEKAQQARHKLEGWKQAFRLDKKLQVKFDRGDEATTEAEETTAEHESADADEPKKAAKSKSGASKSSKSAKSKKHEESDEEP